MIIKFDRGVAIEISKFFTEKNPARNSAIPLTPAGSPGRLVGASLGKDAVIQSCCGRPSGWRQSIVYSIEHIKIIKN
jgi:hypothetical protein